MPYVCISSALQRSADKQRSKDEQKQNGNKEAHTTELAKSVTGVDIAPSLLAAFGGCLVARTAGQHAFARYRRSMLASHVIEEIPRVMDEMFPEKAPETATTAQIAAKI